VIDAQTCQPFGTAPNPSQSCSGGGTTRTDGDSGFPCILSSANDATRLDYTCALDLRAGAQIEEVLVYGRDMSSDGYVEAAIWRQSMTSFGSNYISPTYAGTWQSSGVATNTATPFSFPIYLDSDATHTVSEAYRYKISVAMKAPTGSVWFYAVRVKYTIP